MQYDLGHILGIWISGNALPHRSHLLLSRLQLLHHPHLLFQVFIFLLWVSYIIELIVDILIPDCFQAWCWGRGGGGRDANISILSGGQKYVKLAQHWFPVVLSSLEVVKLLCSSSPRCINKSASPPAIFNVRKLLGVQNNKK